MMLESPPSLQPTYVGFVTNTSDAALLFEACIQGHLPRLYCRLPRSKGGMDVRSGHIFVFEEQESGIKRWTDGIYWSPSRVLNSFILYRELDDGEKGAKKRERLIPSGDRTSNHQEPAESALYGSLIDSYPFKRDGLMKKTFSMKIGEQCWRLVSYYRPEDVRLGHVQSPSQDPALHFIPPVLGVRQALECQEDWGSALISHYGAATHVALPHSEKDATTYRNRHAQNFNVQLPLVEMDFATLDCGMISR